MFRVSCKILVLFFKIVMGDTATRENFNLVKLKNLGFRYLIFLLLCSRPNNCCVSYLCKIRDGKVI